jgi:putative membrane protein
MSIDPGDPRVAFAAERTLLAWIRTGLAMMGFGFVVARFGLFLREISALRMTADPQGSGSLWVGTALVLLGALVNITAAAQYGGMIRTLRKGEHIVTTTPMRSAVFVATILGLIGLGTAVYLLVRS